MMIVLLVLGVFLEFKFEKEQWNAILKVVIVRYVFGLIIGLIFFYSLPFEHYIRVILLIGLILPIGMAPITFSVEFQYNEKLIGTIANITIIISFALMWGNYANLWHRLIKMSK